MAFLFLSAIDRADFWEEELGKRVSDLDFRIWPDTGPREDIEIALVWEPPPGELARLPNLKAILSLGAGVDHIFADPGRPVAVPVARVVDPALTRGVVEYVTLMVLFAHRRMPAYLAQQAAGEWRLHALTHASEQPVGVMGLGQIGGAAARRLARLGFAVAGWSRTPKEAGAFPGIDLFHGMEGLDPFLDRSRILVCLLPLTPATENLMNARRFNRLPEGATFINAGRGPVVVDGDLLEALGAGRLAGAILDVFREEPLPRGHPFWTHPKVVMTPHVAALSDPRMVADQVAENIRRIAAGAPLLNHVDTARGY